MSRSRVHIAESEGVSLQISQGVDSRFGLSDEYAMKVLVALTLNQRKHTGAPGSLYKREAAEISDIHPVIGDSLHHCRIVCGDDQFDARAGFFLQIFHEWLALTHDLSRIGGRDHSEPELWPTTAGT